MNEYINYRDTYDYLNLFIQQKKFRKDDLIQILLLNESNQNLFKNPNLSVDNIISILQLFIDNKISRAYSEGIRIMN